MRHNPLHESTDPQAVRDLIRNNPWATLVSNKHGSLIASHYPVLLDEDSSELAMFTHIGRPDDELHDFGQADVLVIIQGRHGYISPSWYASGATRAPTWNFSAAHCYGIPQILNEQTTLDVLTRLVAHFESRLDNPMYLDADWGRPVARGTVGLRIPITRFICKLKHSQDKDPLTQQQVIAALREPGPYQHPELADDMQHTLDHT